jgi:hypothetical protein
MDGTGRDPFLAALASSRSQGPASRADFGSISQSSTSRSIRSEIILTDINGVEIKFGYIPLGLRNASVSSHWILVTFSIGNRSFTLHKEDGDLWKNTSEGSYRYHVGTIQDWVAIVYRLTGQPLIGRPLIELSLRVNEKPLEEKFVTSCPIGR